MESLKFEYKWALELWNQLYVPTIRLGMAKLRPAAEVPPPLERGLNHAFSTVFGPKAMEPSKFAYTRDLKLWNHLNVHTNGP